MKSKDNPIYKILSVILIVGIVILVVDVIIPKYSKPTPEKILKEIDFSTPEWIEEYVENRFGIYGKDFFLNTAFTYNIRSNKMVVTYASQNSVEDAREYYLALPGAELSGRNDETSLNVSVEDEGQTLKVLNYFSQVSRVFEIELTLIQEQADQIISQMERAFPDQEIAEIPEIGELVVGEVFGGYVRYRYDRLDQFYYPYLPIFSRAYFYEGTEEEFINTIEELKNICSDYRYNETQDTHFCKTNNQTLSIGYLVTDADESVVSISLQEIPQEE